MTTFDAARLRELAEAATPGPWDAECDEEEGEVLVNAGTARTEWTDSGIGFPARSWRSGDRILEKDDLWDDEFDQVSADAAYIAAIDPPTLLALLDELERLRSDTGWEYGRQYTDEGGNPRKPRLSSPEDLSRPDGHRADGTPYWNFTAVRRRKPGQWEPVEGDTLARHARDSEA